ncbi:MAG: DUF389 domain-containing protein [Burkholderiaceae bacterium]|nr:DUF389 domain-containing protein [Burkholderiaceae bacterium]
MFQTLQRLFDLKHDLNDQGVIDAAIRAGLRVGGTNLWVLIFAMLIASVGLNVNSTAVIIGAMLISPLMRPILGIGYGAGISDYRLIRSAARSLAIFTALSMATSTLYFLASPLSEAQSELLARTTPTLWDVLIAFFGGCAGIIAQTRKEESTVIPGAAIATALMPPLCTAGYALATRHWEFLWGALYLFAINAFFIALATYVFVKLMGFPEHEQADPRLQRRAHAAIAVGVLAMAVPSAYLAYGFVQDQLFIASSKRVLHELEQQSGVIVLTRDVVPRARSMTVTLGGQPLTAAAEAALLTRLQGDGFLNATLTLRRVGQERIDLLALKEQLRNDLYANTERQLRDRSARLDTLTMAMAKQEEEKVRRQQLIDELLAQYPGIARVAIADGAAAARGEAAQSVLLISIDAVPRLSAEDLARIRAGLGVRMPHNRLELVQNGQETQSPAPKNPSRPPRN